MAEENVTMDAPPEMPDLDMGGQDIGPGDWESLAEPRAPAAREPEAKPKEQPQTQPGEAPLATINPSGRGRYPDPQTATPEQLVEFFGVEKPEDALLRAYKERYDQFGRSMRAESQVEALSQRLAQQEQYMGQILEQINQRLTPQPAEPDPNENVTEWFQHQVGAVSEQIKALQNQLAQRDQTDEERNVNAEIGSRIAAAAQQDPAINDAFGAIARAEIAAAMEDQGMTERQAIAYFQDIARQTLREHYQRGGNVAEYVKRVAARQYGWNPAAQPAATNGVAAQVAATKQKQAAASALSRGGGGGGTNASRLAERVGQLSDAEWIKLREEKGPSIWDRLADDKFGT